MISVIVNVRDQARFAKTAEAFARALVGTDHEIIAIQGATSIAAGYTNAMRSARGETLVFSADDTEVLVPDFGKKIARRLSEYDILGIAGTDRLVFPAWVYAGPPHLYGQVGFAIRDGRFGVRVFGVPSRTVGRMQALDGVLLIMKRQTAMQIGWDAATFDGLHGWDLDFTYRAYLSGKKLAVCCDIPILRSCTEDENRTGWEQSAGRFVQKFAAVLPPPFRRDHNICQLLTTTRSQMLRIMTPDWR